MDNKRIAEELVAVAKELVSRAPQMKGTPPWRDIQIGSTFKYKGKKWIKKSKSTAVTVPVKQEKMTIRDNQL